jgi:menaquinone reductase, multiheme cytochrome c subunit
VRIRGQILFLAGALVAMGAGWVGFPYALYDRKPQPVDFSHKVHTGEKAGAMKCDDCHAFREDGSFAGIPKLEKCSGCHTAAMGTTVAEKKFIEQYVTPNREPQWESYSRQPDNVYFSHAVHIKRGKLACDRCHGALGTTDTLPVKFQDRISGYGKGIKKMDNCEDCHHQNKLNQSCMDCHK